MIIEYRNNRDEIISQYKAQGFSLKEDLISNNHTYLIFEVHEDWLNTTLRPLRNKLLQSSDKYMLGDWVDNLVAQGLYVAVKKYRQALRDLPKTATINSINWPRNPLGNLDDTDS